MTGFLLFVEEPANRSLHQLAFPVLEQVDTLVGRRLPVLADLHGFAHDLFDRILVPTDNCDLCLETDTAT
jgi:hypothetical protein